MDSFFGDEEYPFYEAMKSEGFDTLPDLINLSFNLNRYPLIQDIGDMGKIGREYLLTVKGCLPADDADDPKYAEFGRELIRSGKGVFTEHGLLFVDEDTPFVRDYDGQNFPTYVYVYEEMLCFLRAEYNGKNEFLYLPCEEEAIDKAFAHLGAPTPDDVELLWEGICIESEKWTERFKEIAAEEGVYELNRLANAVNSADMDLEKLWAVAEYGKAEDAKQLSLPAENLDCFTFLVGASNYEEVGIYVTENNEDFSVNPSVEKFFDCKAFGKYIGEIYYGKFVDGSFISGGAVSPPPHCGYDRPQSFPRRPPAYRRKSIYTPLKPTYGKSFLQPPCPAGNAGEFPGCRSAAGSDRNNRSSYF